MRILFVSTHNLATNPRLVKEIELALQQDIGVSLICCEFNNWSKALNDNIKDRLLPAIRYYPVQGNREPFFPWVLSSVFFSVSKILLVFFPGNLSMLSLQSNKRSWLLIRALKKLNDKIDLVVAHNPGSFFPAMTFAQRNKIPFGIDLEDYHPGETNISREAVRIKTLQQEVLPFAQYISAASPFILEYVQKDVVTPLKNTTIVLNYFPSAEFEAPILSKNEKLKMVWFSQQISYGRGLEQMIPLIKNNSELELHLFGNCDEDFKNEWLSGHENIFIHDSLPQKDLHKMLAGFDIGLAIEPGKDLNNELAISNKILAYFQAGLFVLASNTKAQKQFISMHPEHGTITELISRKCADQLNELIKNKDLIRANATPRFETAKKFCWEEESKKLMSCWYDGSARSVGEVA